MVSGTKFVTAVRALRYDRSRSGTELLPDSERAALQRERLTALVEHAMTYSPFYRQFYAEHGVTPQTPLAELPIMSKAVLMDNWDDVPTDRTLTLAAARIALREGDGMTGEHHIFQTGGSSGEPAVYAYDRAASHEMLANFFRSARLNGLSPRFPKRIRGSMLWAPGTLHMAARLSSLSDVGLFRMQRLPVSAPIPELAAALEQHQPEFLGGYASTLALLATAQLDGRLNISPGHVVGSSEPLTPAHRQRIRQAWGVDAFDVYATTETGTISQECSAHRGMHIFEDTSILEAEPDRALLTNLYNRGFPLIRFVVEDLIVVESGACPCGRTTPRILSIEGRANDVMYLPAAGSSEQRVAVHPSAWTPLTGVDSIADALVEYDGTLRISVVPRSGRAPEAAEQDARHYAEQKLLQLKVGAVQMTVVALTELPRTAMGKRLLVRNLVR